MGSGWRLASAESNAGGLGLLGAGSMYPEVFSPNRAIYLDSGGNIKSESENIPWGGSLLSMCGETINEGDRHFNFFQE